MSLAVGSLGVRGVETNARTFFDGLDVHELDATEAAARFEAGGDAIAAPLPMHPSYEDRAGVPDVVFASVAHELADH
ncbi:MAG: glycosyltransferase family 1 protein [Ilumatobacteraceae bacterium]|nr:glycosyltransferase family 1 protein [Ilumatobacteraceae bacterium]